jgi:hypothetical protein
LYNVEISENPDYLFYSIYQEVNNSKDLSKKGDFIKSIFPTLYPFLRKLYSRMINFSIKDRLPLPEGNYIKIFCGSEHIKPDMHKCDWAFSTHFENEINNQRHMRIPCWIINDFNIGKKAIPPIKKNIDFNAIKKEKTRFCNFIYSQDIYKRNDFFKKLSKYKKIDAPGRCMNNMPPISNDTPKKSRASPNWVKDKLKFIKKYKFTIAFENAELSGWLTEKLTHPMLVNSIPIYFGHKDVSKEFNTKSFINYYDFNDINKFISFIIKVDNDDTLYEKILMEPWYNYNKLPLWFNEENYMRRFRDIFG